MRKRFVTTILICMLSLACILSSTACGGETAIDEVPKGEEVTEEQWKAAFEATSKTENVTLEINMGLNLKHKDNESDKIVMQALSISKMAYLTGNAFYLKRTDSTKTSGMDSIGEEDIDSAQGNYFYSAVKDNLYWGGTGRWEDSEDNVDWEIYPDDKEDRISNVKQNNSYYYNSFGLSIVAFSLYSKDNEDCLALYDLYSSFTYSDGVYTATFDKVDYESHEAPGTGDDYLSYYCEYLDNITVKISIKDGNFSGFSLVANFGDFDTGDAGVEVTGDFYASFNFKNYGNTVIPALPDSLNNRIKEIEEARANRQDN